MGLCAVADIVIATPAATFGFTETKLGIIPAVISTFVVPKIGESHARALFVTGQRFDAERASALGSCTSWWPTRRHSTSGSTSCSASCSSAGPTAARAAKALVRELRALDPTRRRASTVRHIAQQRTSPEGQEGLGAFLEKRPPRWSRDS